MTDAIEQLLAERAGLNLEVLGPQALDRAVAARMAACAIYQPGPYVRLLQSSPSELDNLIDELTILETWFFRDSSPFEFLQQYGKDHHGLRVLSAGCSTGEEPYSIVMVLLEAGLPSGSFTVDACDNSQRALRRAHRAIYGRSSFRQDWHDCRQRWFDSAKSDFALRPEIRTLVQFHREDLLHPIFLSTDAAYDVVFCRNVLIYLRPEAQDALLGLIGGLVRRDGIVVTGHAEVGILLRQGYQPVGQPRFFACRKRVPPTVPEPVPKATQQPLRSFAGPGVAVMAEKLPPLPERDQLLRRARQLADQGVFQEAWSLCERLLAGGSDADAYYLEGIISAARDRLSQAEDFFRRALYLDPGHYESLVQMSLLCERLGEPARAARFRDRAARLTGQQPEALDAQRC